MRNRIQQLAGILLAVVLLSNAGAAADNTTILNVSYDVTREFYKEFNAAFATYWQAKTSKAVTINQSHGGSSKQAQSVINGLEADVVTMNQPTDVDVLFFSARLIPQNWASRLPNHSVPYNSTIVFVVRQGNPKNIHAWEDLIQPGVSVILPNPKTSGNGRYSYLAAWGHALKKSAGLRRAEADKQSDDDRQRDLNLSGSSTSYGPAKAGDEKQAREFVGKLLANVPVLDTGGRGATTTFAERSIGDVLLTFENEAATVQKNFADDGLEVVVPPDSILAENPVAWVDRYVQKHHTEAISRAYLEFLYSDAGQELAAKYYFRPKSQAALDKFPGRFKPLDLFTVNEIAGGWAKAQKTHFADGGIFDQIYQPNK